MPEIGATLREARMRSRIDVSEIEAQTKIRAKYLRALENEEWGLLPGPTFVKSFLRTYAQALGLDGKALVEEYRLNHERPSEGALEPIVAAPRGPRRRMPGGGGPSRGYVLAVGGVGSLIVLLIVLLVAGGGGSSNQTRSTATRTTTHRARHHTGKTVAQAGTHTQPAVVSLSLAPSAVLYVCLIGDNARKLIPGIELQPGETTHTYHARHFLITLGNSSVTMFVDGRPRSVPPSSQAIGYSITKARGRQPLSTGQLPTCK
jgi:cytoskeleton protein RodZ